MHKIASSQYDKYLHLMGITQYEIRHPAVLRGEVALHLPETIKLIIATQEPIKAHDPFFLSVIHAMNLSPDQIFVMNSQRKSLLTETISCAIWFVGDEIPSLFSHWRYPTLQTPSLSSIQHSPEQKRQLWQAIYHYEDYFFTH